MIMKYLTIFTEQSVVELFFLQEPENKLNVRNLMLKFQYLTKKLINTLEPLQFGALLNSCKVQCIYAGILH